MNEPPTALMLANDTMAFGALQAAAEIRLQVPRDLSILGMDYIAFAAFVAPPLTTVHIPTKELGRIGLGMLIEPREMHAREPFTMTVYVQSDMSAPIEDIDLDLEINGPSGHYRFELSFSGPLPAEGTSIFRVTTKLLARICEERYLMAPTEIFAVPGTYTVRATLVHPVIASE